MAIYTFGAGELFGVRTDVSNPTPIHFGVLQDVTIDFNATNKPLYGQYQFPVAVARGQGKIDGKAKFGQIYGRLFADLFWGTSLSAGQTTVALNEADSIPATPGPYTITVTHSVAWTEDLGVVFTSSGIALTRVASAPTTGEYSVAAGVYTFAAADQALAVTINYLYTIASTGQEFTQANPLIGVQPVFQTVLHTKYNGPNGLVYADVILKSCISTKLTMQTKLEDWMIPEFDFAAFADTSGNLFTTSFSEAS